MAEKTGSRSSDKKDMPLDSKEFRERGNPEKTERRREQLTPEQEMARRNLRSHLMRAKNRLRAARR